MTRRVYKGQHITSTGTEVLRDGALAVDLTTNSLYIHDGATPGGVNLLVPTVVNTSFQQVGVTQMPFYTYETTDGKVAKFEIYLAGSDVAYPTISTTSEIVYFTITVIHDGTNITPIYGEKYDTGSGFVPNFSASISGSTISIKCQSNTTYNTVRFIKTIF